MKTKISILALLFLIFSFGLSSADSLTVNIMFIHHSVGRNWLDHSLRESLSGKGFIGEVNEITYGSVLDPDNNRPASLGDIPGDLTDMNHWILWFNDYLGGIKTFGSESGFNGIIMFKSCYPNSNIVDDGEEPGDPFSSTHTIANYKAIYRHPQGRGYVYSHNGYEYKPLEDIFAENPDFLFIPITSPPRHYAPVDGTDDDQAHRAYRFNEWLKNDWLSDYNDAHPGFDNVAVFGLFDILSYADDDSSHPNRLKAEYGGESGDSHPNGTANGVLTEIFSGSENSFIDLAYELFCSGEDGISDENSGINPAVTPILFENYPNPFNASTIIGFYLPHPSIVQLSIYNLIGEEIECTIDEELQSGYHNIRWDGSENPSGIYFYDLTIDGNSFAKRMLLIK